MRNATTALRVPSDNPSPRNEVIERCLPLAKSIAAKLRLAHGLAAPFDDLYALGVDGLMQAADRFDPTRGVAFTTFAYYRIRGAILDSLRREPQPHLLAASRVAPARAPRVIAAALPANDNARTSERSEADEDHPGWSLSEPATVHLASVQELDSLPDESAPHPDEEVERQWLARRVRAALEALPEIERRIIQLHYYEELSFSEIGAELGICKPWAFRLHNKALRQLRQALAELGEGEGVEGAAEPRDEDMDAFGRALAEAFDAGVDEEEIRAVIVRRPGSAR